MDTRDMSQITKLHEPWVALATGVYQHKKRGTTYIIVGLGVIQLPRKTAESRPLVRDDDRLIINKTAVPGLLHCTGPEMSESTHAVSGARVQCEEPLQHGEIVFVYVDIDSGEYSVRRVAEFLDGRFEKVA